MDGCCCSVDETPNETLSLLPPPAGTARPATAAAMNSFPSTPAPSPVRLAGYQKPVFLLASSVRRRNTSQSIDREAPRRVCACDAGLCIELAPLAPPNDGRFVCQGQSASGFVTIMEPATEAAPLLGAGLGDGSLALSKLTELVTN